MQGQIRWSAPLSLPELNPVRWRAVLRAVARAAMAGEGNARIVEERLAAALGGTEPEKMRRRVRPLARRYAAWVEGRLRPRLAEVVDFLQADRGLRRLLSGNSVGRGRERLKLSPKLITEPNAMQPAAVAVGWELPAICSLGELADWLHLSAGELEWFADLKGLAARRRASVELGHYHYRVLAKAGGGVRLIEAPKERMKEIQRQILMRILDAVPVHEAAHGFVRGRSIKTFVAPHVGRRAVLRMDLRDFFPSFAAGRIQALYRLIGYPEMVADRLGGLCLAVTPSLVWKGRCAAVDPQVLGEARAFYARPHLPQGAPTSPALANICAYRLDCRLSGLALKAGAAYTRYADDLAFSGESDFERRVEWFAAEVAAIAHDEGFEVHHRKTRVMRQGVRQHLAGLVTNERVNVMRADFDRLKATLTNCVRYRPESQNREGHPEFRMHLLGRVGFVEQVHPAKGARLRRIFEQIRW